MPAYDAAPTAPLRLQCLNGGGAAAMSWYSPASESENRKLEEWCLTLGPPEIDSVPSGGFGALRSVDTLVIAVWNTDAGAGHLLEFLRNELGLDCRGDGPVLADGSQHFVLLIQEALRRSNEIPDVPQQWVTPPPVKENVHPGERLGVTDVGRRCGLSYIYLAASRNGLEARDGMREDKGNAILSTLPLHDFVGIELPFESARRVVPAATVRNTRGDSLRVASVHLITTPQAFRVLVTANTARERQSRGLLEALRAAENDRGRSAASEDPPISTAIAGDLNTWSTRETALRLLLREFPDSPPVLQEPTRGPFPTDHLLFRTDGSGVGDAFLADSYRRIDATYYSDHNPIIALFRFGGQ